MASTLKAVKLNVYLSSVLLSQGITEVFRSPAILKSKRINIAAYATAQRLLNFIIPGAQSFCKFFVSLWRFFT